MVRVTGIETVPVPLPFGLRSTFVKTSVPVIVEPLSEPLNW